MRLISLHTDAVRALERLRVPFDDLTPEGLWGSPYHLIGMTAEQRAVLETWNIEVDDITPRAVGSEAVALVREARPPQTTAPRLVQSPSWQAPQPVPHQAHPRPRQTAVLRADRADRDHTETHETNGANGANGDSEVPVPTHEELGNYADALGDVQADLLAAEREIVERAAAEAEAIANAKAEVQAAIEAQAADEARVAADAHAAAEAQIALQAQAAAEARAAAQAEAEARAVAQAQAAAEAQAAAALQAVAAAQAARQSGPTRLRVSVGGKYREAAVQRGKILLDGKPFDTPAQATTAVAPTKGDWVFWEYFDSDAGKWRMLDRDWQPSHAI